MTTSISGSTGINKIQNNAVDIADLSATGTASASTFLCGNNTWAEAGGTNTPNFMIRQGTATSLVSATRTKVELNTAIFDTDSGLDADNDRWTVPAGKGGTYLITYALRFETGTDIHGIQAAVYKNGSSLYSVWGSTHYYESLSSSFLAVLAEADYLEMYGLQHSVGAVNASTSDHGVQTFLGGVRLTT